MFYHWDLSHMFIHLLMFEAKKIARQLGTLFFSFVVAMIFFFLVYVDDLLTPQPKVVKTTGSSFFRLIFYFEEWSHCKNKKKGFVFWISFCSSPNFWWIFTPRLNWNLKNFRRYSRSYHRFRTLGEYISLKVSEKLYPGIFGLLRYSSQNFSAIRWIPMWFYSNSQRKYNFFSKTLIFLT